MSAGGPLIPNSAPTAGITFGGPHCENNVVYQNGPGGGRDPFSTCGYGQDGVSRVAFTPTTATPYSLFFSGFLNLSAQPAGTFASIFAEATLVGVNAIGNRGEVIAATFDAQGNGTFATTTPEPTSLALLGTGLLGLVPLARRRKR